MRGFKNKSIVFIVLFIFFIGLLGVNVHAEELQLMWLKSFGDEKRDEFVQVVGTNDGGYIAVGNSSSNHCECQTNGCQDAIIVKYDENGNVEWQNNFGCVGYEKFFSVIQLLDESIIAVGYTDSPKYAVNGGSDALIVKYSKNGELQWYKVYGGKDHGVFYDVQSTSDGGFIVIGESSSTIENIINNKGNEDAVIGKFDANGNMKWSRNFGGNGNDRFNDVKELPDGNFLVVGSSSSNLSEKSKSYGDTDGIIVKYTQKGEIVWSKNLGGIQADRFNAVEILKNGNFVVAAESKSNEMLDLKGKTDGVILLYDENANLLSTTICGGSGEDFFNDIEKINENTLIVVGETNSMDIDVKNKLEGVNGWIVEYLIDENNNGSVVYQECIGGSDYDAIRAIDVKKDNIFIGVGTSKSKDLKNMYMFSEFDEGYGAMIGKYKLLGVDSTISDEDVSEPLVEDSREKYQEQEISNEQTNDNSTEISISKEERLIIATVVFIIISILGIALIASVRNLKL